MNHPYRKIAYLFLLTAILAATGIHGYYLARECIAKWAFTHRVYFTTDELIRIVVPQTDITFQNAYLLHEDEFKWGGQMVDVLYREIRADTLYVYGFRDDAETELKKQAPWLYEETAHADQTPGSRSGNRRKHIKWKTIFDLPYLTEFNQLPVATLRDLEPIFEYNSLHTARPDLDVLSPPPNL